MILQTQGTIETRPLELVSRPEPAPAPGEVLLRVLACGVCRTDLHLVEGDLELARRPIIPGHQIVGLVEAVGPAVGVELVGRRMGVGWLHTACARCDFCLRGQSNLCDTAQFTGFHRAGGYAEFVCASTEALYPMPEGLPPESIASWLCAGIIGYRALKLAEARNARRVGLYGFGGSAHLALQVLKHWKNEVYVATRSPEHQAQARALGADWVGAADSIPAASLESAVLFAPSARLVPVILRALDKGATLAIAGIHLSPLPEMDYQLLYGERRITSVTNNTHRDGEEFLELATRIPIKSEVECFGLDEANEALGRMKRSALRAPAAVLIP